jgi:hypothetical protein
MNKAKNYVSTNPPGVLVEGGTEKDMKKALGGTEVCYRL